MSIELYGTETIGRMFLRLIRAQSRRLGVSEGQSLILSLAVIVVLIAGFTFYDAYAFGARLKRPETTAFQEMVGGLGMGAVSSPKWCFHAFDPRYESICYAAAYPVPGSYGYCTYDTVVATGFGELGKRANHIILEAPAENKRGDKDG
jgi:hypothetical protein